LVHGRRDQEEYNEQKGDIRHRGRGYLGRNPARALLDHP